MSNEMDTGTNLAFLFTQVAVLFYTSCSEGAVLRWGQGACAPQIQKLAGKIFKRFKMPVFHFNANFHLVI